MISINNIKKNYQKIISKMFFIVLGFISSTYIAFASIKDYIMPGGGTVIEIKNDKKALTSIFDFAKDSILGLLAIISITVFLFLGIKLILAEGNTEEMKKILMQIIYSIIGLAIVAMSWVAVKLVSSLNF